MSMPDEQPRMPLITDEAAETQLAATFASVQSTMGRIPNLYRTLGHAPEVLDAWLAFAWPLRHASVSDRALRELVIMRTAQLTTADYEWRQHYSMAVDAGVSETQLLELSSWPGSASFSDSEKSALLMTDELSETAELGDATWNSLREHFDHRECLELVLTAAFYQCVSRVLGGLRVPLEDDAKGVPAVDASSYPPHLTD